jgi:CheY-like chemotaxis protein
MINTNSNNLFMVVDDEFGEDEKEDTIYHMGVPKELALFASNYDEAIEILAKEKDIKICYVDFRIPKNNQQLKANYEDQEEWWGQKLIPQIKAFNRRADIIVYSAYANKSYLQNFSREFKGIVTAYFEKPHGLDLRREYYLRAINKDLSFNYDDFNEEAKTILLDRAVKIKTLLKQTVENMLATGTYLNEVREILPHGYYLNWVKKEIGIQPISAWRMANAAEKLKPYKIEDLDPIGVTVLYHLTDPNVPIEDLDKIIKSAKSQPLSIKEAELIKREYKNQNKQQKAETEAEVEKTKPKFKLLDAASTQLIDKAQTNKSLNSSSPKQNSQKIWYLGANQQHKVIAADPNSPIFLRELPSTVSLCLAFPPEQNWQFQFMHRDTTNIFDSKYDDCDDLLILEIVDRIMRISTEGQDNVAVCFIPNSQILSIIHKLDCHAFVADPDYQKCLNLVKLFDSIKG